MPHQPAQPKVVSAQQWQASMDELLLKEKALTRQQDALNAQRRRLPMMKIDKDYRFSGELGPVSLRELFAGRRQLIVYHFMFDPDWDEGCPGCSWLVDAMSHPAHLQARDTSLAIIARASLTKITAYRERMNWQQDFYSSFNSEFNDDFGVTTATGEHYGLSVFFRDDENNIYRSYFCDGRGLESLGSHWSYLDRTPLGRQETWEDSPAGWPQSAPYQWWRRHDQYSD